MKKTFNLKDQSVPSLKAFYRYLLNERLDASPEETERNRKFARIIFEIATIKMQIESGLISI